MMFDVALEHQKTQKLPSMPFFRTNLPVPPVISRSYTLSRIADQYAVATIKPTRELEIFKNAVASQLADIELSHQDLSLINAIRSSKRKVSLCVEIFFYFPNLWKRNIDDGSHQAVVDAIFTWLELNKSLIARLTIEKYVDVKNPRLEVNLSCLVG